MIDYFIENSVTLLLLLCLNFSDGQICSQAAFDRGSLVAIEPDDRERYASAPLGRIQVEIMYI